MTATLTEFALSNGAASPKEIDRLLASWLESDWLREVDVAFARFLAREVPDSEALLILAAALASYQLGRGHACLDLGATLESPDSVLSLPPDGAATDDGESTEAVLLPSAVLMGITLEDWLAALEQPLLVSDGEGATPLVLVGTRLYLRRYWQYEQNVRRAIGERLASSGQLISARQLADLNRALGALFPPQPDQTDAEANWQKLACALAARSAFGIITGGPGTGKTTTVVKLLALLQSLALAGDEGAPLRIRLAAPTGKAAARLNESIAGAVARLALSDFAQGDTIRAAIPVAVTTLHRLLGTLPDTRRFRHDRDNPLSLDVLVIDEASMVDLEMMNAVLLALPAHARLVLLGDKDQLASVEAGAVLGELCLRAGEGRYTNATRTWLQQVTGEAVAEDLIDEAGSALDQCVAMLRFSYRFSKDSGIGQLASAVNGGDPAEVRRIWVRGYADLVWLECHEKDDAAFEALVIEGVPRARREGGAGSANAAADARCGYRHYLRTMHEGKPLHDAEQAAFDRWAGDVLRAHSAFQMLCALRRGAWGVDGLNRRVEHMLQQAGLIAPTGEWYLGRPVLVTRNDYELGLMNGDIGITLALPAAGGDWSLRVAFAAGDGSHRIKWVLPSRLQAVETVFALTVHKSQGSEFEHAALVLPDTLSPVLTRELVYTGITRARSYLTVASAGGAAILERAVDAQVRRASGLAAGFDCL